MVTPAELNVPPLCDQLAVVIVDVPMSREPFVIFTEAGVQFAPASMVNELVPPVTFSAPVVAVEPVKAVIVLVPPLNVIDPAAPINVPETVLTPPAKLIVVPVPITNGAIEVNVLVPPPLKVKVPAATFTPPPVPTALLLNALAMVEPDVPNTVTRPAPLLLNELMPEPFDPILKLFSVHVLVLFTVAPLLRLIDAVLVPFTVCDTAPCVASVVPLTVRLEELLVAGLRVKVPLTV
jgi:hypothetical protein